MTDFIVEVTMPAMTAASRIDRAIRSTGSHFATHATWRRRGGLSIGSLVLDSVDAPQALRAVPPEMRAAARVYARDALAA